MTRFEYIDALKQALSGLPDEIIAATVAEYERRIFEASAAGQNEDDIINHLDDPEKIAAERRAAPPPVKPDVVEKKPQHPSQTSSLKNAMRSLIKIGAAALILAIVLVCVFLAILRTILNSDASASAGGVPVSEVRTVGDNVTEINLNGPINLALKQGAGASLTVRAGQDLLPRIRTVQEGNTLSVNYDKGWKALFQMGEPIRIELTLPALRQVDTHGTGTTVVSGFSGDEFTLNANGTGNIRFDGRYRYIRAGLFGTGTLHMEPAGCDDFHLDMGGVGSVTISGQCKALTARVSGVGQLNAGGLQADAVDVGKRSINPRLSR